MDVDGCVVVAVEEETKAVFGKYCWHRLDFFFANVKEHATLSARARVDHGVEVGVTENHINRAAPSGWMERLVELSRCAAVVSIGISGGL